jgi:hypothetical protein
MPSVDSEFDEFADIVQVERGVRPLFIVGSSQVDRLLFEILSTHLLPKTSKSKEEDELLEGEKCPFSVRIKMCARLGLIDQTLHKDLERLRKIRNKCAHLVEFSHTESPTKDLLSDLRRSVETRESFDLVRKRYFAGSTQNAIEEYQCVLLTLCALLQAVKNATTKTMGNNATLRISAR